MSEPRFIVKPVGDYHYPTVWDTKANTFVVQITGGTSLFAQAEAERLCDGMNHDPKATITELNTLATTWESQL